MSLFVKICGMTTRAAVDAAIAAGADAIGCVFADSVREVTPEQAAALTADLPRPMLKVAVMQHPTPGHFAHVLEIFAPDWVQTDAEDFTTLELPEGIAALPVYRSGRAMPGAGLPARLLYEGAVSGSGRTADWYAARRLAADTELVLAGGLDAGNVAAAIDAVRPWGVDVSSGVEAGRGVKDPAKIHEFVARVRAMEQKQ